MTGRHEAQAERYVEGDLFGSNKVSDERAPASTHDAFLQQGHLEDRSTLP